jgi:hypothetical protein
MFSWRSLALMSPHVPLDMILLLGWITHVEVTSSPFEDVFPLLDHSLDQGAWLEDVGAFGPGLTWSWMISLDVDTILEGHTSLGFCLVETCGFYFVLWPLLEGHFTLWRYYGMYLIICYIFPWFYWANGFGAHGFVLYLRRIFTYKRKTRPPFQITGD